MKIFFQSRKIFGAVCVVHCGVSLVGVLPHQPRQQLAVLELEVECRVAQRLGSEQTIVRSILRRILP